MTSHQATEPIPVRDLLPVAHELMDAPTTSVLGERTNEAGVCGVRIGSALRACRARCTQPCHAYAGNDECQVFVDDLPTGLIQRVMEPTNDVDVDDKSMEEKR